MRAARAAGLRLQTRTSLFSALRGQPLTRSLWAIGAALILLMIGDAIAFADTSPTYETAMAQAMQADQNDDLGPALTAYSQAIAAAPDAATPRTALLAMIASRGMPHELTADELTALRANPDPCMVVSPDSQTTLVELNGATGRSLDNLSDPENQWPFPALVAAYTSGDQDKWTLVCSVHYQTSEDLGFAEHVGRLLILLRSVLMRRTGQMPAFESPFNVWLSRSTSTTPGGEQWRNNIYLYNLDDGRSSIEWIREIAHEYGHLAIPAIGGAYTSPEAWANGYIGERLMVRWLADPNLAGPTEVERVWGRTFAGYPNFKTVLIDPPMGTFESIGLDRPTLDRSDEIGMRYVIGLLLWIDLNKGGHALGTLLWNLDATNPDALYDPSHALGVLPPPHAEHTKRIAS
jgi:hypothetical protein